MKMLIMIMIMIIIQFKHTATKRATFFKCKLSSLDVAILV